MNSTIMAVDDDQIKTSLKTNPSAKDLPAVVNDRCFNLDCNEAIGDPRVIDDGHEAFSAQLSSIP